MKRGERFVVNVAPELDISSIDTLFQKLNVLFKASMVYSLRLDLPSAMKVMLDLASDLAEFEKAVFYLLDEEDKSYYAELVHGFSGKLPSAYRKGNIFLEWTVENHLPIRIQEAAGPEVEAAFSDLSCRSVVSIPIIVEGTIKAVIQLFSSKPYNFTDDNIRFLWILVLQLEGLFHKMTRTDLSIAGGGKDPFTDLPMRPQFDTEMEREFTRSRRNKPLRNCCCISSPTVRTRRFPRWSISSVVSLPLLTMTTCLTISTRSSLVSARSLSGTSSPSRLLSLCRPTPPRS